MEPIAEGLIIVFRGRVNYDGRASSRLATGTYLLMHKPDGATTVHGASMVQPLNYQSAKSKLYKVDNGYLCQSKKEKMVIEVDEVVGELRVDNWSDNKIKLVRTEKELSDKLADQLPTLISGIVDIRKEYQTVYGPIDLVAIGGDGLIHVIEVKRTVININAIIQLRKYMEMFDNPVGYVAAPAIHKKALEYAKKYSITYLEVLHTQ